MATPKSPNFIVIMTDDQGPWARGRTMPELITPVLDQLGAEGHEMTRFFCASPVCSPARATLATGRMPSAHGVHDWLRGDNSGNDTTGVHYLENFSTTAQLLNQSGYTCAHSGKWHLGDARQPAPGFTHWYSHRDGGGPYFGAPVIEDGVQHSEGGYITHAITENARKMLDHLTEQAEPFFLQVNYTAPHAPWTPSNHPQKYLDLYKDCDFPSIPREEPHEWFNWGHTELADGLRNPIGGLIGFCASLTAVDEGVGQLLEVLDHKGVREDTYVIFMSDNGFSCGHHGIWGKGNGTEPLNVWDNSILVPFIINRPGTIAPTLDSTMTSAASLHSTILELAGAPAPTDPLIAGESFAARLVPTAAQGETNDVGLAKDPAAAAMTSIVIFDEYGGTRMIRTESHKYVVRYGDAPCELYDLIADPQESVNLFGNETFSAIQNELAEQLHAWFAKHSQREYDGFARPVTGMGQNSPTWSNDTDSQRYAHPIARPSQTPGA